MSRNMKYKKLTKEQLKEYENKKLTSKDIIEMENIEKDLGF